MPIILLVVGYLLLVIHHFSGFDDTNNSHSLPDMMSFLLVVSFALFTTALWSMWVREITMARILEKLIPLLLIPILALLSLPKKLKNIAPILFLVMIASALGLRIATIKMTPFPPIDTFIMLNEAPRKILLGANPYVSNFTPVFPGVTPDYFTYWPAAFLLQLPFVPTLSDPRILFILSDIIAAFVLFLIAGKTMTGMMLALLFLFRPYSLFIIESSWLTPLNFVLVLLAIYLLVRKVSPAWVGIVVGLVTSVQLFHAVLFFIIGKYVGWSKKFIAGFFLSLSMVVPYFLASPADFLSDTLLFYFRNPPHPAVLIHESLNINALFFYFFQKDISPLILNGIIFLVLVFSIFKQQRRVSSVAHTMLIFFFTFFLFGRQAFVNYYFFIASLAIVVLVLEVRDEGKLRNAGSLK